MREQVEAAALAVEGQLFLGENHLVAGKEFLAQPGDADVKMDRLLHAKPGYLTSRGRLVELEEAERIAQEAGQPFLFGSLM